MEASASNRNFAQIFSRYYLEKWEAGAGPNKHSVFYEPIHASLLWFIDWFPKQDVNNFRKFWKVPNECWPQTWTVYVCIQRSMFSFLLFLFVSQINILKLIIGVTLANLIIQVSGVRFCYKTCISFCFLNYLYPLLWRKSVSPLNSSLYSDIHVMRRCWRRDLLVGRDRIFIKLIKRCSPKQSWFQKQLI